MKEILIVTIILDHPTFNYQPLADYLSAFDRVESIAHTATNKSLLLRTEVPERKVKDAIQKLLGPNDYCSVDIYDSNNGPEEITTAARTVIEWIAKEA